MELPEGAAKGTGQAVQVLISCKTERSCVSLRRDPGLEGALRGERVEDHQRVVFPDDPGADLQFGSHQVAVDTTIRVGVVGGGPLVPLPDRQRGHRGSYNLAVRVIKGSAGPDAMVLEDDNIVHLGQRAQLLVARSICPEDCLFFNLVHQGETTIVLRVFYDDFVSASAVHIAEQRTLQAALRRTCPAECGVFVRERAHLPGAIRIRDQARCAVGGWRRVRLIAGTEGTALLPSQLRGGGFGGHKVMGPLGPLRRYDDPVPGGGVLSDYAHLSNLRLLAGLAWFWTSASSSSPSVM